jgi:pyruvate carboxylase
MKCSALPAVSVAANRSAAGFDLRLDSGKETTGSVITPSLLEFHPRRDRASRLLSLLARLKE